MCVTYYLHRIPAGSYPNIESRDSPLGGSCNYVDETDSKLAYKKSVFKKKSTSSTATVIIEFLFYFTIFI